MTKLLKLVAGQKEYAQQYQLNGLLTGEETPPQKVSRVCCIFTSIKRTSQIFNWLYFTIWDDMKFKIEQIAIRPKYPIRAKQLLSEIGAADWSRRPCCCHW